MGIIILVLSSISCEQKEAVAIAVQPQSWAALFLLDMLEGEVQS